VGQIKYSNNGSIYIMEYDYIDLLIDGKGKKGDASKIFNHSCNPNCVLEQWCIKGMPHMCFFACKDIKTGTELMFNYNWKLVAKDEEDFKSRANICKCGTKKKEHYMEQMVLAKKRSKK
jgi:SET domain-containing protein